MAISTGEIIITLVKVLISTNRREIIADEVNAEISVSCRGLWFLNIGAKEGWTEGKDSGLCAGRVLKFEFVPNSFYGFNIRFSKAFANLADVYIDGAVADDYVVSPNFVEYLFPGKYPAGFGS